MRTPSCGRSAAPAPRPSSLLLAATAAAALALPSRADVLAEGYASARLFQPGGVTRTLSNGDVLAYDGSTVDRYDSSGVFVETVYALPEMSFAAAFAVNRSETLALVGESTNGDLFAVDLVQRTGSFLVNLPFNYDAVFESQTRALVSAAARGGGNDVVRVDLSTGDTTPVVHVAGASGPVALAEDGDLLYATASAEFPAPFGATALLRFESSRLTGAPVLGETDATTIASGFDGAGSLAYDPATGAAFLADNYFDFANSTNRLVRIAVATGAVDVLVDGDLGNTLSNLEVLSGGGHGVFLAFQPGGGGRLNYVRTDFVALDERRVLEPVRPELALSGPGTGGGAGPVALDVTGGPANGFAVLIYAPLSAVAPNEVPVHVGGLPLVHTALSPAATLVGPVLALDGSGAATHGFPNHGGLVDVFACQAVVADGTPAIVGSTTADTL